MLSKHIHICLYLLVTDTMARIHGSHMLTNFLSPSSFFHFFHNCEIRVYCNFIVNCVILKSFKTYLRNLLFAWSWIINFLFLNFSDFRPVRVYCLFSLYLYGSCRIKFLKTRKLETAQNAQNSQMEPYLSNLSKLQQSESTKIKIEWIYKQKIRFFNFVESF